MSRDVHNGPTDDSQARGTRFTGDPDGGEAAAPATPATLALDGWHRARGARMVEFAVRDCADLAEAFRGP